MLLTHVSELRHVLLKFDGSRQLQRVDGPVLAVGVRDVAARILAAGITGALVSCKKVDASSTVFAFCGLLDYLRSLLSQAELL